MSVAAEQSRASENGARATIWEPPHYVRSLSLAILAIFLGFQISGWVFAVMALQQGRVDFRGEYAAGYMVRSGNAHRLYDDSSQLFFQNSLVSRRSITLPFDHLAYEALFFAPFSFLQFKTAYFVFLFVNLAALALSILLIRRWTPTLNCVYPWLTSMMMVVFLPTAVALMQGQDSILLLVCLTTVFAALESGGDLIAGAVLSLGMFKFQIMLPIALLFLLWKRWRFMVGFSVSTIALLVASFALTGKQAARAYIGLLLSMSVGLHSAADQARLGVSPTGMPNLRGLVLGFLGHKVPGLWEQVLIVTLSVALMVAAYLRGLHWPSCDKLLVAIMAAALVSYHSFIHDMAILLLPMLVLLNECIAAVPGGPPAQRIVAASAALLFTAPVLFCFAPASFFIASLATCAFFYALLQRNQPSPRTSLRPVGDTR